MCVSPLVCVCVFVVCVVCVCVCVCVLERNAFLTVVLVPLGQGVGKRGQVSEQCDRRGGQAAGARQQQPGVRTRPGPRRRHHVTQPQYVHTGWCTHTNAPHTTTHLHTPLHPTTRLHTHTTPFITKTCHPVTQGSSCNSEYLSGVKFYTNIIEEGW